MIQTASKYEHPEHVLAEDDLKLIHITILDTKDKMASPKLLEPDIAVHVKDTMQEMCEATIQMSFIRVQWVIAIEKFTLTIPVSISKIITDLIDTEFYLVSEAGVNYKLTYGEPDAMAGPSKVRLAAKFSWCHISYGTKEVSSIPDRFAKVFTTEHIPTPTHTKPLPLSATTPYTTHTHSQATTELKKVDLYIQEGGFRQMLDKEAGFALGKFHVDLEVPNTWHPTHNDLTKILTWPTPGGFAKLTFSKEFCEVWKFCRDCHRMLPCTQCASKKAGGSSYDPKGRDASRAAFAARSAKRSKAAIPF